ncbi:MAG: hypothetical protein AABZ31_04100 [Bdellovibrionota bacterium]
MKTISFYKIAFVTLISVLATSLSFAAEYDAVEIDALKYSHKKRFAEISPYGVLTSFKFKNDPNNSNSSERFGVGASVVVKSLEHLLFEAGLAYLPTGAENSSANSVELNYLAAPLSLKIFARDMNLGLFFKAAVVPSYLVSSENDQNLFKDSDAQIWLGVGGLFPSQMENRVFFDFVWARSLGSVMKNENVYNEGLIFSAGLTL